jgi:hypothetical protein
MESLSSFKDQERFLETLKETGVYRFYFISSPSCGRCKIILPTLQTSIVNKIKEQGINNTDFYSMSVEIIPEDLFKDNTFPEISSFPTIVAFASGEQGFSQMFKGDKILTDFKKYLQELSSKDLLTFMG